MRLIVLPLVALALSSTAWAGVVKTSSNRTILVDVDTSVGPTDSFSDSSTASGNWFSDPAVGIFSGGVGGSAFGLHDTNINPNSYSGLLSMGATADGGIGFDLPSSYAETTFSVDFTVTAATGFTLVGSVDAFGTGDDDSCLAEVSIVNLGGGGTPTQLVATVDEFGSFTPFNVADTLLPGNYQLMIVSRAISTRLFLPSFSDAFADVNFTMILEASAAVPSLSVWGLIIMTALMMGAGAFVVARRANGQIAPTA